VRSTGSVRLEWVGREIRALGECLVTSDAAQNHEFPYKNAWHSRHESNSEPTLRRPRKNNCNHTSIVSAHLSVPSYRGQRGTHGFDDCSR
jgi:hypothetical protein